MRVLTFAEDNPLSPAWFLMLHQGFATATPGSRSTAVLASECQILHKLDAVSEPAGEPDIKGFQPRRLREPCAIAFSHDELALLTSYVSTAAFQPYLSPTLMALLSALASAPEISE